MSVRSDELWSAVIAADDAAEREERSREYVDFMLSEEE